MRRVELEATVRGEKAREVFDALLAWERYPELAPHVRATTVHRSVPGEGGSSSWELYFRSGLLSWSEEEFFDPGALRIRFEQTYGDFDEFRGTWQLRQDADDVRVRFDAEFDFGIPSMEGILDPIAERVIKETVAWAVTGLFPDVTHQERLTPRTPPGKSVSPVVSATAEDTDEHAENTPEG
ncbi:SRPBCC family protein [Streptomyces albireticuli]|uniref:Cyclase n=1 Tax=Streptomyces albireticuli TaxID=1940 RepID=A0A2A2D9Q5_9ACTN|nr:SRPBCC family protein [Streptomyces albireticuli]MCD9141448.1 SRPBCC family protein [Streptomyces albireticuli]MCD9160591.1 SRPBCC family protein [Streptomyces albireticuli]MCD9195853.1 SRPBCC family protein [Streptomyces albireticuli]PAU48042.1 cyclase [Streptomyces albireticuli]